MNGLKNIRGRVCRTGGKGTETADPWYHMEERSRAYSYSGN